MQSKSISGNKKAWLRPTITDLDSKNNASGVFIDTEPSPSIGSMT